MTHKIAHLLGEAGDKIGLEIEKLEAATGHTGHDAKLVGQHQHEVRVKIAELGLDPEDTTPQELYHALRARYKRDAEQFQTDFGLHDDQDSQVRLVELANNILHYHRQWALKPSAAKSLLQELPPLRTRKVMGYRSNDSMLKRADTAFIVAMARRLESSTWQTKWAKAVKAAPAANHEMTNLKIIMTADHELDSISSAKEAAAIIVPLREDFEPPQGFGQVLEIVAAAQRALDKDLGEDIDKLHASLRWWAQNLHLTAWLEEQPVSFNVFDIARDINGESDFEERSYEHAGQKIWQKLSAGYDELKSEFTPQDILQNDRLEPLPAMVEAEVENV